MIKAAASAFFMPLIYLHMLFSQLNPIQNYMMVEFYAIMYHSAPERVQQWLYVKDPEVQYETHELYPRVSQETELSLKLHLRASET
jgi:hypothetical protein